MTDLSVRFEAILKALDTRKAQHGYKATDRERALLQTVWEQITPTFEEYGKLRKRVEQLEGRTPRPCNESYREQPR